MIGSKYDVTAEYGNLTNNIHFLQVPVIHIPYVTGSQSSAYIRANVHDKVA